jgi:TetR/AcrR family transcriptional regulator, repressor of fatR-cypB operon
MKNPIVPERPVPDRSVPNRPEPVRLPADSGGLNRRDRERIARRAEMLSAAKSVLAERGYVGATLDEIASRAEFGKGTLYNYFPDGKEEILFAVFDEIYDDLLAIIRGAFPKEQVDAATWRSEARTLFSDFVTQSLEYFEAQRELFMILTKEAHRMCVSECGNRASFFLKQRMRAVSALAVHVGRAMEAGAMRPLPADAVAAMLIGNINGLQLHRALRRAAGEPETPADQVRDPASWAAFLTSFLFDGLLLDQA